MNKTEDDKKNKQRQYNAEKQRERRAKLKAQGKPLNNSEVLKKASEKFRQEKKQLTFTLSPEVVQIFKGKAESLKLTDNQCFEYLVKNS